MHTLGTYYDKANKEQFANLFGHLAIGKDPTPNHSEFHILKLDFSGISKLAPAEFEAEFNQTILGALATFRRKYGLGFELSDFGVNTFKKMTDELEEIGGKVCLTKLNVL
jgi:Predicted AAA-ATPase